jgi:hypothetical protein
MAILAMPTSSFSTIELNPPEPVVAMSKARGNYISELRVADPMWTGSLVTTALSPNQLKAWEAFISKLTDRVIMTDIVHPLYRAPMAYSVETFSALAWPATVGVAEVNTITDLRTLVLSGVPDGTVFKAGDRCSVVEGSKVAYSIIAEDVTASGVTMILKLTPRLPLGLFTTAATVRFLNPFLRARIARNTWSAPVNAGEATYGSFEVFESAHEDV